MEIVINGVKRTITEADWERGTSHLKRLFDEALHPPPTNKANTKITNAMTTEQKIELLRNQLKANNRAVASGETDMVVAARINFELAKELRTLRGHADLFTVTDNPKQN
jgi:hypothetical protein